MWKGVLTHKTVCTVSCNDAMGLLLISTNEIADGNTHYYRIMLNNQRKQLDLILPNH